MARTFLNVRFSKGISFLGASLLLLAVNTSQASSVALQEPDLHTAKDDRLLFLEARKALKRNDLTRFTQLKESLSHYPLAPYLEYYELEKKFNTLPISSITDFLDQQRDTALGDKAYQKWMKALYKKQAWPELLQFYRPENASKTQQCYQLHALLKTAQKEQAFNQAQALWMTAKSQPKPCNAVFRAMYKAGEITDDMLWQRHLMSINARQRSLSYHLRSLMTARTERLALLLHKVHRSPKLIDQHQRFEPLSPRMKDIITHGLQRLARKNAQSTFKNWMHYKAASLFTDEQQNKIEKSLLLNLAKQGQSELVKEMVQQNADISDTTVIEWQIREALEQKNWPDAYRWIVKLPKSERETERWQYWYARAVEALVPDNKLSQQPLQVYRELAGNRSFYGFLAADRLANSSTQDNFGHNYSVTHIPTDPSNTHTNVLRKVPAIQRSEELFMINYRRDAHREWRHATSSLPPEQLAAAAKLAKQWGWYMLAIQSVSSAKSWDDLQLRFPLAYADSFALAASTSKANTSLLMAIARQESAFLPDAKSSAGALGLMQLMPKTARQTARRSGIRYRKTDLLTPKKNIKLGSRYFSELLSKFKGNRILATAAYNAGPYRVSQWLNEKQQVPFDIWIEVIPFNETRQYVQRVLSYAVIYSHRLGKPSALISNQEISQLL